MRTDLLVLDGLERQAELWSHGRRERLDGQDLAYARYFEQQELTSSKLKALIQTSRVIERPRAMVRVRRPWVLFYSWIFLFSTTGGTHIDNVIRNQATGSPTSGALVSSALPYHGRIAAVRSGEKEVPVFTVRVLPD